MRELFQKELFPSINCDISCSFNRVGKYNIISQIDFSVFRFLSFPLLLNRKRKTNKFMEDFSALASAQEQT